jgi:hypothetical protein
MMRWCCYGHAAARMQMVLLPAPEVNELEGLKLELLLRAAHPMARRPKVLKKYVGADSEARVATGQE